MKLSLTLAPQYWSAAISAAVQQAVAGLVSAMLLDGGRTLLAWCIVTVAFWAGSTLVVLRRPSNPSRGDLAFIGFGFVPLFAAAFVLRLVIEIRGYW